MMRGGRVMGCCEGEGGRVVMGTVRVVMEAVEGRRKGVRVVSVGRQM